MPKKTIRNDVLNFVTILLAALILSAVAVACVLAGRFIIEQSQRDEEPEVVQTNNKIVSFSYVMGEIDSFGGKQKHTFTYQIPQNWVVTEAANPEVATGFGDCSIYKVSNPEKTIVLSIKRICQSWSAKRKPLQGEYQIISNATHQNDGSPFSRVRMSNERNLFTYSDVDYIDEIEKASYTGKLVYGNVDPVTKSSGIALFEITLEYTGSESKKSVTIAIVDDIVKSYTFANLESLDPIKTK